MPFTNWSAQRCGNSAGQRQRQESSQWLTAHRGDIAQPAGEAAVSDGICRMPFPAKVHAFQTEVGGD